MIAAAAPLDLDVDTDGEYTRWLEGHALNAYPDPPEHRHTCPECYEEWSHRDAECSAEAIPDPWYRIQNAGHATCPECAAPGSNGSESRWCSRCHTFTVADPVGNPGCGCAWGHNILPFGSRATGFVQDPTRRWTVTL